MLNEINEEEEIEENEEIHEPSKIFIKISGLQKLLKKESSLKEQCK